MSPIALNVAPITSLAHYMLNGQEKKGGRGRETKSHNAMLKVRSLISQPSAKATLLHHHHHHLIQLFVLAHPSWRPIVPQIPTSLLLLLFHYIHIAS